MRRRLALLTALLVLAACQPEQRPNTAAPVTGAATGIALPASDSARRYDTAIKPVDETRAVPSVQRPAPVVGPGPSERERQAIAAWVKEEAAASGSPLTIAPPPRVRSKLSLPGDVGALPRPSAERMSAGASTTRELALPPSAGERPELAKSAEAVPAPSAPPPPAPPPPAPPQRAEPATVPAPSTPRAQPAPPVQTAAAAPALQRPAGLPLTTVIFAPRSANLSDEARIALGFFAQDPKTQRLRRIELWAGSSAEDPADAGKIAFARALSVHAYLIDLGLKAQIEIAGYSEMGGVSPDRVDVMAR